MGRHHLLHSAILPDLLLVVVLTLVHGAAALSLPPPTPASMDRLAHQEVAVLKQRILEGLGFTKVPDISKVRGVACSSIAMPHYTLVSMRGEQLH